jgi:capsular polysaccharide biosynthesis protein
VRLDEVVLQALEKDPQRRYQQASHLKTAVENTSKVSEQQESEPVESKKPAPPGWQMYVAGFLSLGFLELGILALADDDSSSLVLGILAFSFAVLIFVLTRKQWLPAFVMGSFIALGIGLGVAGLFTGNLILGICGLVVGLFVMVAAYKKLRDVRRFFAGFILVFTLVFGSAVLVTFLLPDAYAGVTRVKIQLGEGVKPDPLSTSHEIEKIRSGLLLGKVVDKLKLDQSWLMSGKTVSLTKEETLQVLKKSFLIVSIPNTSLLEIRAYSEDPKRAADLANAIADAYRGLSFRQRSTAEAEVGMIADPIVDIIDRAIPAERPSKPNRPLNLAIGAFLGLLLGTIGGALNDRRGKRAHRQ